MRSFLKSTAIAALIAGMATGAGAADWTGPYLGAYFGQALGGVNVAGALAGYNFNNGNFVYGGEVDYMSSTTTPTYIVFFSGRAGVLVSPNFLAFATLGYGWLNGNTPNMSASVGGEFAVNDNVSIRADYVYQWDVAVPAIDQDFIRLGGVWNF